MVVPQPMPKTGALQAHTVMTRYMYSADIVLAYRYIILRRYQRDQNDPAVRTSTLPTRRHRPQSTSSRGNDVRAEGGQLSQSAAWIESYVEDSVKPMDPQFNEHTLHSTRSYPDTFDEMLSDTRVKHEACEFMSMSMLQQYTATSWRNDGQTLNLAFQQDNVYLPSQTIETDILHPISPSISATGSSGRRGTPASGVAKFMDPVESWVADPGPVYDCAASGTYLDASLDFEFLDVNHLSTCGRLADCFDCNNWSLHTLACQKSVTM